MTSPFSPLVTALFGTVLAAALAGCDPAGPQHPGEAPDYTPPRDHHDVTGLITFSAADESAEEAALYSKHRQQGETVIAPFRQQLMQALQGAMAIDTVKAIEVCQLEAPDIAEDLSDDTILVGRSSHRLRNPINHPQPWVADVLDHYLAHPEDREPLTVVLEDDRIGYAEPIVTQPLCLACHGSDLAPDVAKRIRELYPDDQATGFATGDLRGVFWAEFPE